MFSLPKYIHMQQMIEYKFVRMIIECKEKYTHIQTYHALLFVTAFSDLQFTRILNVNA